jgi:hypothetical protein
MFTSVAVLPWVHRVNAANGKNYIYFTLTKAAKESRDAITTMSIFTGMKTINTCRCCWQWQFEEKENIL